LMHKYIETTEIWFLRRLMRIPWTARKTNTEILIEANEQKQIVAEWRRRQAKFIGHVLRKGKGTVTTTETMENEAEECNEK
jgi:ribosomal 50S subunit-associated protein YjgA (DUF615 family)